MFILVFKKNLSLFFWLKESLWRLWSRDREILRDEQQQGDVFRVGPTKENPFNIKKLDLTYTSQIPYERIKCIIC